MSYHWILRLSDSQVPVAAFPSVLSTLINSTIDQPDRLYEVCSANFKVAIQNYGVHSPTVDYDTIISPTVGG